MAIHPICDICKIQMNEFGALLFSPPDKQSKTRKFHICQSCYQTLVQEKQLTPEE